MSMQMIPGRRGIVSVRADASDANKILADLRKAFDDFKTEHSSEMSALRKDVVQAEKVDRINAEITKLQTALDQVNAAIAAAKIGGGAGTEMNPAQKAHKTAFENFFRNGVSSGLLDLQVKAAVTSDNDPKGGYVVDSEKERTIDRVLGQTSAIRRLATVRQIGSKSYTKLVNQGGAAAGWVGEKQARGTTATPTLAEMDFPAMELYAQPAATQSVLDDAQIDIGAWLSDEVAITFAEQENAAFVNGDGDKKPYGFVGHYDKVANASYAWGKLGYLASGVAGALTDGSNNGIDKLTDLTYAIKSGYRGNASWLMNRSTTAIIRKIKDTTGNYLWQPPVAAGQPALLLGYPVADDDNMPDVGANKYPIWFGDWRRAYLIVDRIGVRVIRDDVTQKPYVLFYTTKRVGGGVQNFEAIKALKIATS